MRNVIRQLCRIVIKSHSACISPTAVRTTKLEGHNQMEAGGTDMAGRQLVVDRYKHSLCTLQLQQHKAYCRRHRRICHHLDDL